MSYKIGLVGLPNVGKSSLFTFFTKKKAFIANFPFATIDPSIGLIAMTDNRLKELNDYWRSNKVTTWSAELIDIAGLIKGASQGHGLGNSFLSHIREVDLICHVVRCFDNNEEVIHVENSIDPVRDYQIVQSELILADLQQIEKRMKKMKVKSEADQEEKKLLEKIRKGLAEEVPLNQMNLSLEERRVIKGFNLLSEKPAIVIANYSGFAEELQKISSFCQEQKIPFFPFALKMESEIEELTAEEKEILGCRSSDLAIFAEKVKEALDLKSFLTVGKDEIKNWTTTSTMSAKECAGLIHSSIKQKFSWVEIYNFDDWKRWNEQNNQAKDFFTLSGKVTKQNADYLVKDGDICYFL